MPILTTIINKSLSTGQFPSSPKKAIIRPLLKKPGLDQEDLKNYCPVSNLLDLSSAFDTVDHKILTHRMETTFGIKDFALSWLTSYLKDRSQCVSIDDALSDSNVLLYGVPQGSVLGPKLFCSYTKPIGDIVRRHGLQIHLYADDSQIYTATSARDRRGSQTNVSMCRGHMFVDETESAEIK